MKKKKKSYYCCSHWNFRASHMSILILVLWSFGWLSLSESSWEPSKCVHSPCSEHSGALVAKAMFESSSKYMAYKTLREWDAGDGVWERRGLGRSEFPCSQNGGAVLFLSDDLLRENRARLLYLLKVTIWGLQFNCRDIFRKRNSMGTFVSSRSRNIMAGSLYDDPCTDMMATGPAPARPLGKSISITW